MTAELLCWKLKIYSVLVYFWYIRCLTLAEDWLRLGWLPAEQPSLSYLLIGRSSPENSFGFEVVIASESLGRMDEKTIVCETQALSSWVTLAE